MFGISKREIANKIAEKIVSELKSKGFVTLAHVGTLRWTAGTDKVRFEQDPGLIKELDDK